MIRAVALPRLFLGTTLWLGMGFLYLPIVLVIVYSFNASKLVTIWAGLSTQWYGVLLRDGEILDAAQRSVEIALIAATGAVVVGTLAGYTLARFRRFRGRTLFFGMVSAPLVMPEIIMGIALLLMYVAMQQAFGWPAQRGMLTITLSHVTFCSAFVAVIVQSRLAGMDGAFEEAAADLGARPATVFFLITLPLIAPAMIAGWLLALSLSIDDVVISEFTAGPTSTTLPLLIFSRMRLGITPEINALATVVILLVAFLTFTFTLWQVRPRRTTLASAG